MLLHSAAFSLSYFMSTLICLLISLGADNLHAQPTISDFVGEINLIGSPNFNIESADGTTTHGRLNSNLFSTDLVSFGGQINFLTGSDAGILRNKMVLNQDGDLGINTSNPSELLDVRDAALNSITLNGVEIEWKRGARVNSRVSNILGNTIISNRIAPFTGANSLKFELKNITNSGSKTQMRVDYSGDVGLGEDLGPIPSAIYLEHKYAQHANPIFYDDLTQGSTAGIKFQNSGSNNRDFSFYVHDILGILYMYGLSDSDPACNILPSGTYNVLSDERRKDEVNPMSKTLENLMQLEPSTYHFKNDKHDKRRFIGIMAQELIKDFPEVVSYNEDADAYHVAYHALSTLALKAIQEQQTTIKEQQSQLAKQQSRIDQLIKLFKELEK